MSERASDNIVRNKKAVAQHGLNGSIPLFSNGLNIDRFENHHSHTHREA